MGRTNIFRAVDRFFGTASTASHYGPQCGRANSGDTLKNSPGSARHWVMGLVASTIWSLGSPALWVTLLTESCQEEPQGQLYTLSPGFGAHLGGPQGSSLHGATPKPWWCVHRQGFPLKRKVSVELKTRGSFHFKPAIRATPDMSPGDKSTTPISTGAADTTDTTNHSRAAWSQPRGTPVQRGRTTHLWGRHRTLCKTGPL